MTRVTNRGKRSPLSGLEGTAAFDLVYRAQPLHRAAPHTDDLVILNRLDNDDKHRLLHPAFVYPSVDRGTDFVSVTSPGRVRAPRSLWKRGDPLENGTRLASYVVRGGRGRKPPLEACPEVTLSFATGDPQASHTTYEALMARVRGIVDNAAALIDSA